MCLLIAESNGGKFIIGFNRDEDPSRISKEYYQSKDVFYPIDKRAGGTWIGNNSNGEIFALLNNAGSYKKSRISRGNIIINILNGKTNLNLLESELDKYNPFQLFYYYKEIAKIMNWDGEKLSKDVLTGDFRKVMSSSSYGEKKRLDRLYGAEDHIKNFCRLNLKNLKNILSNSYVKGKSSETISSSIIRLERDKVTHSFITILDNEYRDFNLKVDL